MRGSSSNLHLTILDTQASAAPSNLLEEAPLTDPKYQNHELHQIVVSDIRMPSTHLVEYCHLDHEQGSSSITASHHEFKTDLPVTSGVGHFTQTQKTVSISDFLYFVHRRCFTPMTNPSSHSMLCPFPDNAYSKSTLFFLTAICFTRKTLICCETIIWADMRMQHDVSGSMSEKLLSHLSCELLTAEPRHRCAMRYRLSIKT